MKTEQLFKKHVNFFQDDTYSPLIKGGSAPSLRYNCSMGNRVGLKHPPDSPYSRSFIQWSFLPSLIRRECLLFLGLFA